MQVGFAEFITLFKEFFFFKLFTGKRLHHAVAGDILLRGGVDIREFFTDLPVQRAYVFAVEDGRNEDKRQNGHQPQGERDIHGAQVDQRRHKHDDRFHQHMRNIGGNMADVFHITGYAGNDIARAVFIEKPHFLMLQVVENMLADFHDHALRRLIQTTDHQVTESGADENNGAHTDEDRHQPAAVVALDGVVHQDL